jgi:hypothetical protein
VRCSVQATTTDDPDWATRGKPGDSKRGERCTGEPHVAPESALWRNTRAESDPLMIESPSIQTASTEPP